MTTVFDFIGDFIMSGDDVKKMLSYQEELEEDGENSILSNVDQLLRERNCDCFRFVFLEERENLTFNNANEGTLFCFARHMWTFVIIPSVGKGILIRCTEKEIE